MGAKARESKDKGSGTSRGRGTGHGARGTARHGKEAGDDDGRAQGRRSTEPLNACFLPKTVWAPQAYIPSSDGGSTWGGETTRGNAPLTFMSSDSSQTRR
ncbi:hypothetical protein TYRP_023590 [Tyrophagus putrescentiae]|nr:hypothetical protein TYRP_023590 [Tyrophagus putrescentiae]